MTLARLSLLRAWNLHVLRSMPTWANAHSPALIGASLLYAAAGLAWMALRPLSLQDVPDLEAEFLQLSAPALLIFATWVLAPRPFDLFRRFGNRDVLAESADLLIMLSGAALAALTPFICLQVLAIRVDALIPTTVLLSDINAYRRGMVEGTLARGYLTDPYDDSAFPGYTIKFWDASHHNFSHHQTSTIAGIVSRDDLFKQAGIQLKQANVEAIATDLRNLFTVLDRYGSHSCNAADVALSQARPLAEEIVRLQGLERWIPPKSGNATDASTLEPLHKWFETKYDCLRQEIVVRTGTGNILRAKGLYAEAPIFAERFSKEYAFDLVVSVVAVVFVLGAGTRAFLARVTPVALGLSILVWLAFPYFPLERIDPGGSAAIFFFMMFLGGCLVGVLFMRDGWRASTPIRESLADVALLFPPTAFLMLNVYAMMAALVSTATGTDVHQRFQSVVVVSTNAPFSEQLFTQTGYIHYMACLLIGYAVALPWIRNFRIHERCRPRLQ